MKRSLLIAALLVSTNLLAASSEGGHHASATSLIAPIVNLSLLLGFLIWKLKGPLRAHLTKKATDISSMVERANVKAKEAEMMMANQKKKLAGVDSEVATIEKNANSEIERFEKMYSKETTEKIDKLKVEAVNKIEAEKKALLHSLNNQLIDDVISKTKTIVKNDKNLNTQVSENLLKGLN